MKATMSRSARCDARRPPLGGTNLIVCLGTGPCVRVRGSIILASNCTKYPSGASFRSSIASATRAADSRFLPGLRYLRLLYQPLVVQAGLPSKSAVARLAVVLERAMTAASRRLPQRHDVGPDQGHHVISPQPQRLGALT